VITDRDCDGDGSNEPLAPLHFGAVLQRDARGYHARRVEVFGGNQAAGKAGAPAHGSADSIRALFDLIGEISEAVVLEETWPERRRLYVTAACLRNSGARCFNTLLDEQTILGLAQGLQTWAASDSRNTVSGILS